MQIERHFDKQRELWKSAMRDTEQNREGFRETAIRNVEAFNEAGNRENYHYFFRVGYDDKALTISDTNEATFYVEGYTEAIEHADYLSSIWNETVWVLEDNSEVIVHVVAAYYSLAYDGGGGEWEDLLTLLYPKKYDEEPVFDTLDAALEKGKAESEAIPSIIVVLAQTNHWSPVAFCYNGDVFRPSTTSGQQ